MIPACAELCFGRFTFRCSRSGRSIFSATYYRGNRASRSLGRITTGRNFLLVLRLPLFEFGISGTLIEQVQAYTSQQVFQVQYTLERQDAAYGVSGLRTFLQPTQGTFCVDVDGSGNGERVVSTDLLDEFTITRRACIGYYDKIEGSLLGAMSLQSDFYWHK